MPKSRYLCKACEEFKEPATVATLAGRTYCKSCLEGALKHLGEGYPDRDSDEKEESHGRNG